MRLKFKQTPQERKANKRIRDNKWRVKNRSKVKAADRGRKR